MGGAGKSTYFLSVSGNTQLLGDAPQGDTLQLGVVDGFPQGLLGGVACLGGGV